MDKYCTVLYYSLYSSLLQSNLLHHILPHCCCLFYFSGDLILLLCFYLSCTLICCSASELFVLSNLLFIYPQNPIYYQFSSSSLPVCVFLWCVFLPPLSWFSFSSADCISLYIFVYIIMHGNRKAPVNLSEPHGRSFTPDVLSAQNSCHKYTGCF